MKDYSQYTLDDFKAMSNSEFEQFAKMEYRNYLDNLEHEDDYMPYSEFYTDLSVMMGRQSSSRRF